MEEKILIVGKPSAKIIPIILIVCGIILLIFSIVGQFSNDIDVDEYAYSMMFVWPELLILGIFIYFMCKSSTITITNKRAYGKTLFGSRVDIPVDSISAVGMVGIVHGITVSSSSGTISFPYISNYKEIHSTLSEIIINRQETYNSKTSNSLSTIDEIKKYKELLDNGAITQEEYEKKKKDLLEKT